MIKKAKTIEEVYAAFEPYPLNEKKQINDFFVDTYEARGTNAVKLMSLALEYSNNPYMLPESQILTLMKKILRNYINIGTVRRLLKNLKLIQQRYQQVLQRNYHF